MSKVKFHDINDPGFIGTQKKEEPKKKRVTGIDDSAPVEEEKAEPEVRLISAEWKPGPNGFDYNEQCFLDVSGEYLKETIRARIRGNLFGIYDGQEYDLSQEVVGYLDRDSGIARLKIKRLWFIDEHHAQWQKDPKTPCKYKIKGIFHSRSENEIDSSELEMPQPNKSKIIVRLNIDPKDADSQDDTFRLFSTDDAKSYEKILTIKNDKIPNDGFLDLEFTDMNPHLSYTLEINPGNEGKTYLGFENKKYKELTNV